MSTTGEVARESWLGGITSLLFWGCLFAAGGLYASVSLSPKWLAYLALEREFRANQWRLVALDRQVSHLEKVIEAQTHDPAFVREQARSAFDAASPDEQRMPVESHLRLNIEVADPEPQRPFPCLPWYAPILTRVARSHNLGNVLLGAAAALVLLAFTFLHERRWDVNCR